MSTITGPLTDARRVTYRDVFSDREKAVLYVLIALQVVTGLSFVGWLLWPSHLPTGGAWFLLSSAVAVACMVLVEAVRLAQGAALVLFAARAATRCRSRPQPGLRVAVLTTIVPGKEPVELV